MRMCNKIKNKIIKNIYNKDSIIRKKINLKINNNNQVKIQIKIKIAQVSNKNLINKINNKINSRKML